MNRPKLTLEEAKQYMSYAPASIEKSIKRLVDVKKISAKEADSYLIKAIGQITEPIILLGIRGYYLNSMGKKEVNDRGIYDDAFVLIAPNFFNTYNTNTDPSKYTPGVATLLPGLHYFRKGKHGISRPGGGYEAFRPDTPDEGLPVIRDLQMGIHRGIAINIHMGGEVYTNSAGCQTVFKDQWIDFKVKTYDLMRREEQRRLPYLLIEN